MKRIEGLLVCTGSWVLVLEFDPVDQEYDAWGLLEQWHRERPAYSFIDGTLINHSDFAAFREAR